MQVLGRYLSIPILLLAVALQSGLVPQIQVFGGVPDLPFLVVFVWAIQAELDEAILWAFIGGILQDLMSTTPTGTSTLGMVIVIFTMHLVRRQLFEINFILAILFVIFGTILQYTLRLAMAGIQGFQVDVFTHITYVLLPTLVYNLVFVWIVYFFLTRIQRQIQQSRLQTTI